MTAYNFPHVVVRDIMKDPEDVDCILKLHACGMGSKSIAKELGISRNTVRHYIRQKGWKPCQRERKHKSLDTIQEWIKERFQAHRGNAEVVRQELETQHKISVSLRTVERQVAPHRKELEAIAKATIRFETNPGEQLQIDFGTTKVLIDGQLVPIHLFVSTLGYSRRIFVQAFRHERQAAWFEGMEHSFHHFGGVPQKILMDNARALVKHHDPLTREVIFNDVLKAFAKHWGFRPQACAPYRARTKGKDERAVGYVKRNAIAGRDFASWSALEAHLEHWMKTIADQRKHGSTGEAPMARFERNERDALLPINGKTQFIQARELQRIVQNDSCVEVDTNRYSVPWQLIGQSITVQMILGEVILLQRGNEVTRHPQHYGSKEKSIKSEHLKGIVTSRSILETPFHISSASDGLIRACSEYEAVAGGTW